MLLTYRAYGHTLASDRPLPELPPSEAPADITVTWNARSGMARDTRWTTLWRFSTEEPWVTTARVNGARYLRFGRFADVTVSGDRIDVARPHEWFRLFHRRRRKMNRHACIAGA